MVKASDIYLQQDIEKLLKNKFVVVIGDSIQRAIYKDIVILLQQNKYLSDAMLRKKGEFSFQNDELVEGGKKGMMNNGIFYREVRQYQSDFNLIRFYFVTRCYNNYIESILSDLSEDPKPDVIIMNSCLWDISRYGLKGVDEYKKNLERLFTRFEEVLPKDCLVVWNTTLPISKQARGGFLVPEIEFMNNTLRLDILEANFYARQIAVAHGFDVLDLHYYLRHQLHRRAVDGIHWDMTAHRRMTNLLMTHITEAWDEEFPGRNPKIKEEQQKLDEQKNLEREKEYRSPLEKLNQEPEVNANSYNSVPSHCKQKISRRNSNEARHVNHEIINQQMNVLPSQISKSTRQAAYEAAFRNYLTNNLQGNLQMHSMNAAKRSINMTNNSNIQPRLSEAPVAYQRGTSSYRDQSLFDRYGGPVTKVDNSSPFYHAGVQSNYNLVTPGYNTNPQVTVNVNNFQWQPYANENYQPPNRNIARNHMAVRNVPYAGYTNNPARQVQMRPPWQVY